ncbi:FAD-dependent oxidoreductase [Candidatus Poribacteria bacterium]|nr:FAD-dependent oxidoreductase [Candidatus Poribacteria bacterium]MBT5534870.1 FAD-dependent oxidoreductase [Candidatus Poribacteria bacterium]MBT5714117.1 FAD-dependent oxidoreductase [Candidatus Poribacteria bacterium]MBT7804824.1 FAD-dependent oxidoreductase [Candidatus Poribacteria bacterium]
MDHAKYLLIGGGLASACAAESIRERDADGSVMMIGREAYVPYHRPPLSKGYLVEGDWEPSDFSHHDEEWYEQNNVEFRGGVTVTAVDVESRQVSLSSGDSVAYEKLLIATGADVIRLNVPGADLEGIHYLRAIPDSDALIAACKESERSVVVGGGFIGLELASSFRRLGLDVTLVYMEDRLWPATLTPYLSEWLASHYRDQGVRLLPESQVAAFQGDGRVGSVALASGAELAADFAALGVGVRPAIGLVEGTPLADANGIATNGRLETAIPGIYAAGDVAWYQDVVFGKHRRVEHTETARGHGTVAGANMAGADEEYSDVPYFFSDLFDLELEFAGDFDVPPDAVELDGSPADGPFIARYSVGGRLSAAVCVDREEAEVDAIKDEIREAQK